MLKLLLRDKTECLFTKVGYLESRLGQLASSSTDLSCRLVQSEEEKLMVVFIRYSSTRALNLCICPE